MSETEQKRLPLLIPTDCDGTVSYLDGKAYVGMEVNDEFVIVLTPEQAEMVARVLLECVATARQHPTIPLREEDKQELRLLRGRLR